MPRVAQYQPQVRSQVARGARAPQVDVSSGTQALAQGIDRLGQGLAARQERIDATEAEDALVSFERDANDALYNSENGYFNSQGRDAFDNSESIRKRLTELQGQYSAGIKSPNATNRFKQATDRMLTSNFRTIDRHASSGLQAWEIATSKARVENSIENASLNYADPERLAVNLELGRQSVIDQMDMQGLTGEAKAEALQTFESSFATSAITAAINSSSVEGQAALDQYGDRLEGPAKAKLNGQLERVKAAEKTQRDANAAIATATSIVSQYDSRNDALDEVNKIKDPELRDATLRQVTFEFNQRSKAEAEARTASFEEAESHLLEGGTAQSYQLQDPDGWDRLSAKQKQLINKGAQVQTDWSEFTSVMTLPRNELSKVDPDDYTDKLAPAERTKLANAVIAANGGGGKGGRVDSQVGRTRAQQTTSALEQMLGKKKRDWGDKQTSRANQFYSLLDDEVSFREEQKGGQLSSQEYTQLLGDLSRETVLDRSFFGVDFLVADTEFSIANVPTERINSYTEFLRRNNTVVTGGNIDVLHRATDTLGDGEQPSEQLISNVSAVMGRLQQLDIPITPDNVIAKYNQALGR